MNLVTKQNRKEYLNAKQKLSPAYVIGWLAAESNGCESISADPKTMYYYEAGYNDCKSNEFTIDGQPTAQEKSA